MEQRLVLNSDEFSQVETYTRTFKFHTVLKYQDKQFEEKNFFTQTSILLDVFFSSTY